MWFSVICLPAADFVVDRTLEKCNGGRSFAKISLRRLGDNMKSTGCNHNLLDSQVMVLKTTLMVYLLSRRQYRFLGRLRLAHSPHHHHLPHLHLEPKHKETHRLMPIPMLHTIVVPTLTRPTVVIQRMCNTVSNLKKEITSFLVQLIVFKDQSYYSQQQGTTAPGTSNSSPPPGGYNSVPPPPGLWRMNFSVHYVVWCFMHHTVLISIIRSVNLLFFSD